MPDLSKARILLETINNVVVYLTDEEISDIALVIQKALNRMENEQK